MLRKIMIGVGLIIVLVMGIFAVNHYRQPGYHPEQALADWACLKEEHAFLDSPPANDWHERRCPICNGRVARVHMYYNIQTDEVVEIYREALKPDASTPPIYEDFVVKAPNGQWQQKNSEHELSTGFPTEVTDHKNLRYASPNSSYRQ